MSTAFDPIDLAGKRLANRIAMAPMTRSRAYGRARARHRRWPPTTRSARAPD